MRTFFPLLALLVLGAALVRAESPASATVSPADPALVYSGRRDDTDPAAVRLGYSGARVRMAFEGPAVGMAMDSEKPNWVEIVLDGKRIGKRRVEGAGQTLELASDLPPGPHTIEVVKVTEGMVGPVTFRGFVLPAGGKPLPWPTPETRRIEFVGDSITCGYGIEVDDPKMHFSPDTENFCDAYAANAARALGADYLVVARSGIGMLRNYNGPLDGSPDNLPAIYDRALFHQKQPQWDPRRFVPDVVCINLGTNDFSASGVDPEKFQANYRQFVEKLAGQYPQARFVLLAGPMLNSEILKTALGQVAEAVNAASPGKVSVFELSRQGAAGFGADYHPSRAQGIINGKELAAFLSKLMDWPLKTSENEPPRFNP